MKNPTSTPKPTSNSFDILIDDKINDNEKKEEFTSKQIFLQKATLINKNNNLKLKVNHQVDKINKLYIEKQELKETLHEMSNTLEAMDRMYDSLDMELPEVKQKAKKTKSKQKKITIEL